MSSKNKSQRTRALRHGSEGKITEPQPIEQKTESGRYGLEINEGAKDLKSLEMMTLDLKIKNTELQEKKESIVKKLEELNERLAKLKELQLNPDSDPEDIKKKFDEYKEELDSASLKADELLEEIDKEKMKESYEDAYIVIGKKRDEVKKEAVRQGKTAALTEIDNLTKKLADAHAEEDFRLFDEFYKQLEDKIGALEKELAGQPKTEQSKIEVKETVKKRLTYKARIEEVEKRAEELNIKSQGETGYSLYNRINHLKEILEKIREIKGGEKKEERKLLLDKFNKEESSCHDLLNYIVKRNNEKAKFLGVLNARPAEVPKKPVVTETKTKVDKVATTKVEPIKELVKEPSVEGVVVKNKSGAKDNFYKLLDYIKTHKKEALETHGKALKDLRSTAGKNLEEFNKLFKELLEQLAIKSTDLFPVKTEAKASVDSNVVDTGVNGVDKKIIEVNLQEAEQKIKYLKYNYGKLSAGKRTEFSPKILDLIKKFDEFKKAKFSSLDQAKQAMEKWWLEILSMEEEIQGVLESQPEVKPEKQEVKPEAKPEIKGIKPKIIDIKESVLLSLIGREKLLAVRNNIIYGQTDLAETQFKNIFNSGINTETLAKELKIYNYTVDQFRQLWEAEMYKRPYDLLKAQLEQNLRNVIAENTSLWEKIKIKLPEKLKKSLVILIPALAIVGAGAAGAVIGGGAAAALTVAGATGGFWRGLKTKVSGIKNWFSKKNNEWESETTEKMSELETKKRSGMDVLEGMDQLHAQEGNQILTELSSMLSQGLRETSAAVWARAEGKNPGEVKANMELALQQIKTAIDEEYKEKNSVDANREKGARSVEAEKLIKGLYNEESIAKEIDEALKKDPGLLRVFKGIDALKSLDWDNFTAAASGRQADQDKKESDLRKIAAIVATTVAGGVVGYGLGTKTWLRPLAGALAGGYFGARLGKSLDAKSRDAEIKRVIEQDVKDAEKTVVEYEGVKDLGKWFDSKKFEGLERNMKNLRVPLTLGLLKEELTEEQKRFIKENPLKKIEQRETPMGERAKNALRRLEHIYLNMVLAAPKPREAERYSAVGNLIDKLNKQTGELSKGQKKIKDEIQKGPGKLMTAVFGVSGALLGAGAVMVGVELRDYVKGHYFPPTEVKAGVGAGMAVEHGPRVSSQQILSREAMSVVAETKTGTGGLVESATIKKGEGILHETDYLIKNHKTDIFQHNGKPWTQAELHKWKVDELERMGFKFRNGKWGYPTTVHEGARIDLIKDENGNPHIRLGDENVTFHKDLKWMDAEKGGSQKMAVHEPDTDLQKGRHEAFGKSPKDVEMVNTITPEMQAQLDQAFPNEQDLPPMPSLYKEGAVAIPDMPGKTEAFLANSKTKVVEPDWSKNHPPVSGSKKGAGVVEHVTAKRGKGAAAVVEQKPKVVETTSPRTKIDVARIQEDVRLLHRNWDTIFNDTLYAKGKFGEGDRGDIAAGFLRRIETKMAINPDWRSKIDEILHNSSLSPSDKVRVISETFMSTEQITPAEKLFFGTKVDEDLVKVNMVSNGKITGQAVVAKGGGSRALLLLLPDGSTEFRSDPDIMWFNNKGNLDSRPVDRL